jgi:hypothetical protein
MRKKMHITESGRKLEIPVFEVKDPDDLYDKYRDEIYRAILECMTRMSSRSCSSWACFAIEINGEELLFNLDRNNIQEQIGLCLQYYESIEEYETCAYIQTLNL